MTDKLQIDPEGIETSHYDDGRWVACTMGFFVGDILVDTGRDPAVLFRVVANGEPNENHDFVRTYEVISIPDGCILDQLQKLVEQGADVYMDTKLKALLEARLLK